MEKQKELQKQETVARIEEEIRDEKFLERQALHYLKKQTTIVESDVLEKAPEELTSDIKKRPIAFEPNSDKQTWFVAAAEDHVLFGGGRAGGKTEAFIADPLRYVDHPKFRALVIRRTMKDLRDLINRAREMYRKSYPTVEWKKTESLFLFPSGATIEYGHLDNEGDLDKYHGQQYTWLGIDEISQLPEYNWFSKLLGSLRTVDYSLKAYFRATTNWSGVGVTWVKEYFKVEEAPPNTTIFERGKIHINGKTIDTVLTKKWLNSTIFDNPAKRDDHSYLAYLDSQPAYLKKAWLYGETSAVEGAAFPEFERGVHTCDTFPIPASWKRYRGADYGYGDGAACVWIAVAPDKTHFIYREFICNSKQAESKTRLTADKFSEAIANCEIDEFVRYGIIDSSVWAQRGDSGPSLYEQMMIAGTRWRPADKSKGSRVAGKNKIHQMLQVNPETEKPYLIVLENCPHVIRMFMGIPVDEHNAEDVDTDSPLDHQYDALRYVLMSRTQVGGYSYTGIDNTPVIYDSTFFG
jgi:hypothetical protein